MSPTLQVVGFQVGKEYFGVDITSVQEIVRVPEITRVPEAAWCMEGVINLRGRIVPVIDLKKRLRLGEASKTRESRILVADVDKRLVGLLVDSASEVLRIPAEAVEPTPETVSGVGIEYIRGVGKVGDRLIILLDLSRVMNPDEIRRLHKSVEHAVPQPVEALQGSAST
ncbi:MAG: chemotaxis protein CheW [Candidatus Methylomirabilales bacterium]